MKSQLIFFLNELPDSWVFIEELKHKYNIRYVKKLEDNCIVLTINNKKTETLNNLKLEANNYQNVEFWTQKMLNKFLKKESR